MRHRLALDEFAVQRRIGRTAAYGEIIGRRDHGPPVDIGAAKDEVARGNVDQRALFVVGTPPGNLANLAKTAVVDHPRKPRPRVHLRSEEHTSELQSLMRISYAVFCLKKKNKK